MFAGLASFVYGARAFAVLARSIERATEGGASPDALLPRSQSILDGPWYLTWLTSAVGSDRRLLCTACGSAWSTRRWDAWGLIVFISAQALAFQAVRIVDGHGVHHFFNMLTAAGVTSVVAAAAAALLASGFAVMRRVTV